MYHRVCSSRTTYDFLAVDSGEESEEEVEVVETASPSESHSETQKKPTKSAIKKASRLARIERRQQQKALKKAGLSAPSSDAPSISSSPVLIHKEILVEKEPAASAPASNTEVSHSSPEPPVSAIIQPEAIKPEEDLILNSKPPQEQVEPQRIYNNHKGKNDVTANTPRPSAQDAEKVKKRQNMLERTLWTFIMIGGFIGLLLLGHAYMILLVMLCQTLVYREVTALFSLRSTSPGSSNIEPQNGKDPWSKTLNWYFFAVTNYFLYGESIIYYFKHVVFADAQLLPFATNHRIISFTLYTIGFMGFVMSLKKGYLKQQFGLFCWVHMSLLLIVVSSHFIVNNILEGLIWFWVPASLVICNDVFAYIFGISFGRTPLIALSPKKTVEGFVGAFWSTILFSLLWGTYFMRFNYMICPVHDLGVSAWSSIQCTPNPVFVWKSWQIWAPVATLLSTLVRPSFANLCLRKLNGNIVGSHSDNNFLRPVPMPFIIHVMLCILVAPFGGFFASGFKRAFNIKDFGHSIPGHGGMTDRMDCQFLMGVFTYVYYSSLIREHHATVGSILQTIVSGLTVEQQLELIADLKRYLGRQGIMVP
ncbi:cytidylyltransferase family-domain-containing protein [Infundibulicybe gibba]|nr:cytidylyltransferase family-domain-containing protein [Infundibulicybe gibba]